MDSDGPAEQTAVTYQGRPETVEDKRELAQAIRGLVPGDRLVMTCPDATRSVTVEQRLEPGDGTPQWTCRRLCRDEAGRILSGHGTEYMLTVDVEDRQPLLPRLDWPSSRHFGIVLRIDMQEQGEQIQSDTTADDLYWRVGRYDGR